MLGFGDSFVYNEGILCYLLQDYIRVLNVYKTSKVEQVLNIGEILRRARFRFAPGTQGPIQLSLLHYSRGVLACLCEVLDHPGAFLFALDITCHETWKTPILFFRSILATHNLFVRHNGLYLYYGTLSVPTPEGHFEWLLHGMNLRTGQLVDTAIHLKHFLGSEIGQSVCFEIYGNHLYAVSNQNSLVAEEVDWTSFYCCLRISLDDGKKTPIKRIWRRQHREGPINDSWTDLSLRMDRETGDLVIMECRREWQDGGSENFRTYYRQHLDCFNDKGEQNEQPAGPIQLPPNEPLTSTLGPNDKPNYEPAKKRVRRHYHPEYSREDDPSNRRDFILAKTKYHTYNLFTSSFLDIVSDPQERSTLAATPDRLRLRIGSRKRKSPIDENGDEGEKGMLYRPEYIKDGTENTPLEMSDERFESRGIYLWPPPDAPEELLQLLCPTNKAGRVDAISDERTLIYSTESAAPNGAGRPIILVNFDPSIRFKGLKRLGPQTIPAKKDDTPVEIDKLKPSECPNKPQPVLLPHYPPCFYPQSKSDIVAESFDPDNKRPANYCFYPELALYAKINHGFWLR